MDTAKGFCETLDGMSLPQRKRLPHTPPSEIRQEDVIFFLTVCCQPKGFNHLAKPKIGRPLIESIAFRHHRGDWWIHLALVMPDHLHTLASFPPHRSFRDVVSDWKRYTARSLGIVWQRDFFDHRLRQEESLREKADYILMNPVRQGLTSQIGEWPYVWHPDMAR